MGAFADALQSYESTSSPYDTQRCSNVGHEYLRILLVDWLAFLYRILGRISVRLMGKVLVEKAEFADVGFALPE